MQRSKEQRKANRAQPKVNTSKGKPQQAKAADAHLQSSLVKQVASSHRQTSSLITPGTRTQGPCAILTPHREWLTHYQPHRVPVQLGDNSVVWSEGVGVCWFEPMLEGSPAPLVRFSNVLYVPWLASNLLSLFALTVLGYTFTGTGHSLAFSKEGQVLFQAQSLGDALASSWVAPYLLSTHHRLRMQLLLHHSPSNSGMNASTTERWMQLSVQYNM